MVSGLKEQKDSEARKQFLKDKYHGVFIVVLKQLIKRKWQSSYTYWNECELFRYNRDDFSCYVLGYVEPWLR